MAFAIIKWYKETESGRKRIPPTDIKIYPIIKLEGKSEIAPWNLWLVNKEIYGELKVFRK